MNTKWALFLPLLLAASSNAAIWDGDGTYYFGPGDSVTEAALLDQATLIMTGGEITAQLQCDDSSALELWGGYIHNLGVHHNSTANLRGGQVKYVAVNPYAIGPNLAINVYADPGFTWEEDPIPTYDYDRLSGTWYGTDEQFSILVHELAVPYVNIIPEPCSLLFLVIGSLIYPRR